MSAESESDEREADEDDSPTSEGDVATRVVFSYPADLSRWGRDSVERSSFRAYLRKTVDPLTEGRVFEEFVGVGCCGNTLDVPLRVKSVDGDEMGPDTEIAYTVREACGIDGGWQVQSAEGPAE